MNDPYQPEEESDWDALARDFGLDPEPDPERPHEASDQPEASDVDSEFDPATPQHDSDHPTSHLDEPVPIEIIFDDDDGALSIDEPVAPISESIEPGQRDESDGPDEGESYPAEPHASRDLSPEAQEVFDTIFVPRDNGRTLQFPRKPLDWPSDEPIAEGVVAGIEDDADEIDFAEQSEQGDEEEGSNPSDETTGDEVDKKERRRRRRKKKDEPREPARSEAPARESSPVEDDKSGLSESREEWTSPPDEEVEAIEVPTVGDWDLPTWDELIASLNRN